MKQTKFEKRLVAAGRQIISWDHDVISNYLLSVFKRDIGHLTLLAAADNSKRKTLLIHLDHGGVYDINLSGSVIYNKKERTFTHICYSDKYNWAVHFSIKSKVYFSFRDFHNQLKHVFPLGYSEKKVIVYLLNH